MTRCLSHCGKIAFRVLARTEAGEKHLTHKDEKLLLRLIQERLIHDSTPLPPITHLELMICEDCNLRCDYCFIQTKRPVFMSKEIGEKAIDFLINQSAEERQLGLLFFGGEPLLNFETIAHIVHYAKNRAFETGKLFRFSITTNGTLLNEQILQFFKEHGIHILLSIDGDEKSHDKHRKTRSGKGSFSLIASKFGLILNYFPDIGVRVTPHPDTVHDLFNNVRFLLGVGFRRFIIGPAHGIDWPQEAYDVYEQQMREIIRLRHSMLQRGELFHLEGLEEGPIRCSFGCRAALKYMAVAANGDLAPCSMFLGTPGIDGVYKFGNVYEGLHNEIARRELIILNAQRDRQCRSCNLVPFCSGGCPVNNHKATGCFVTPAPQQCRDMWARWRLIKFSIELEESSRQMWASKISAVLPLLTQAPMILYFSRGKGAGHAIKDIAIVQQLQGLCPDINVIFVSYDKGARTFVQNGFEVIDMELPANNPFLETQKRAQILIEHFQPSLIVSHEEFCIPPLARHLGIPCLFITHWFIEPEHPLMKLLESADEILFIEREGIFDCPSYLTDKVRYVGPVLRSFSYHREDRERARKELDISPKAKVVLVVPGAAWPEAVVPIFDLVLSAFEQMAFSNKLLLWLAGEDEASLRSKVNGRCDIVVKGTEWEIDRLMVASDLAITKGSYTAMCELDYLGIPSIALLHGHNLIDEIYAKYFPTVVPLKLLTLSPNILYQTMESLLRTPPTYPPEHHSLRNGSMHAAQAIVHFINSYIH